MRLRRLAIVVAALVGICVVSLAGLYVWLTRGEVQEHRYATFAEARASEDAGWLPGFLPASATLIHEWHDLDTDRAFGSFQFDSRTRQTMQEALEPWSGDVVRIDPDPSFSVNLPYAPSLEQLSEAGFNLYEAEGLGLAVRWTDAVAYYWALTP